MEKTLAVITVVITDASLAEEQQSSGATPLDDDGINWRVTLRPNADKAIDSALWEDKNAAETALAHELGHVVARLFKDPTENQLARLMMLFGDSSLLMPAEKRAWELGEIIYPELSQKMKSNALSGYERMAK